MKRGLYFRMDNARRMMNYLLLLWMCIAAVRANAQSRGFNPELKRTYSLADTSEIKELIKKFDSLLKSGAHGDSSILFNALEKSRKINYNKGIVFALSRLAAEAQVKGDHKLAIRYFTEALQYMGTPERSPHLNIAYNNLGMSYSNLGQYEQALHFYNKALAALARGWDHKNATDSAYIYINIGVVWARMEENDYALQTWTDATKMADRKKDTVQIGMIYLNIAEIYYRKQQWQLSEDYYRKVLKIGRAKSIKEYELSALTGLALNQEKRQNYKEALAYLNDAMLIAARERIPAYNTLETRIALGSVYLQMKDYSKAKTILIAALADTKKMDQKELLQLLEPKVAAVNAATGNYREAYEHMKQYSGIKDSFLKQEKTRSLEAWMNSLMAEKNKAMLTQQLHITRQENQLQRMNFLIGGTILGALLLLAISFALVRNYRHKQVIQQSFIYQLQQQQEINQLKAQVRGEEHERQRIAHELHDGIASQLWAIKLNVDSMQQQDNTDEAQRKKLGAIFQQLTDATQDVRKTAHNLMPDLLLEEGLATALASLCEKTGKSTRLEVDFQEYGIMPRVDDEITLSIYRMVQELIQNVLKHARNATHLLVQISCVDTLLNITVEDNGTSARESGKEEGIGIKQIRKRTNALKGHFDLQIVPDKGTTAYLEFDLQYLL